MIKLKTITRNCKRIGISGGGGKGKSTAIIKMYKKPLILDLEGKFPIPEQPLVELNKPLVYGSLMAKLLEILNEPNLKMFDALVIDSISEVQSICETHAIDKDYKGDKGKYSSYMSGPNHELPQYFGNFLQILKDIETKHEIDICLIIHTATATELNPLGDDFSKIKLDLKKHPYSQIMKWLDCLGCVYEEPKLEKDGLKHKAVSSTRMISFDNSSPLYEAKQMGLTEVKAEFDKDGNWYKKLFNKGDK